MNIKQILHLAALGLALGLANMATVALAHTHITASTPAEGATVARTRTVTLTFNEAMLPPTVAATIVMTAMPGMPNHQPTTIRNFTSAWSNGNKTITLSLREPLRAGTYEARWQGAGTDGHRMTGTIHFTVS